VFLFVSFLEFESTQHVLFQLLGSMTTFANGTSMLPDVLTPKLPFVQVEELAV
jgi:hypothetical protein